VKNVLQHTASITRVLLWCGAVAGPLFIAMFLLEGASAADYNTLRHPVSSLALSPSGWLQVANFLAAGILYLAFAAGLWRTPRTAVGTRVGVMLIAAAAVGLIGSGLFITDPVSGYPPGTQTHQARTPPLERSTTCSPSPRSSGYPRPRPSSAIGSCGAAITGGRYTPSALRSPCSWHWG
jgi:hypothetical protein